MDADFTFNVSVASSGSLIHDVHQTFTPSVTGTGIAAFDFTRIGPPHTLLSTVAANCTNGDVAGCPQIQFPTDSATLAADSGLLEIEREVQLVRAGGGSGIGTVTSWDILLSQTAANTQTPEPATWTTLLFGIGLLGFIGRQSRLLPQSKLVRIVEPTVKESAFTVHFQIRHKCVSSAVPNPIRSTYAQWSDRKLPAFSKPRLS